MSSVPISLAINEALDTYGRVSQQLFATLQASRTAPSTSAPSQLLETLTGIDQDLGQLLDQAEKQATTQKRIEEVLKRIREYDAGWREDVREATRWKKVLDAIVEEGQRDRAKIEGAARGALAFDFAVCTRVLTPA